MSENNNEPEERIKVLEYELRKKSEEINNLRELLTTTCIDNKNADSADCIDQFETINSLSSESQPHEIRSLRFLVYEYLLHAGCRISAVQFAEEIADTDQQDLDSWEEVGLNCSRPPTLPILLRRFWLPSTECTPILGINAEPQVDHDQATFERTQPAGVDCSLQTEADYTHLLDELASLSTRLNQMQDSFSSASNELTASNQRLTDAREEVSRLESEHLRLSQESTYWRNQLLCLKRDHPELVEISLSVKQTTEEPLGTNKVLEEATKLTNENEDLRECDAEIQPLSTTRCTPLGFLSCASSFLPTNKTSMCPLRLADSLDEMTELIGSLIEEICSQLPLQSKETALPLLTQAICLHPAHDVRSRLLHSFFRLYDLPSFANQDCESRCLQITLTHCHHLAVFLGPVRVESELLPQIWSQLNERPQPNRFLRSLLVSVCGVIASATPARLRSSLLLSVLSSVLEEETDDSVRVSAICALSCVVALMEDGEKLAHLVGLMGACLQAAWRQGAAGELPSLRAFANRFLPAVLEWCLEVGRLRELVIEPTLSHLLALCLPSSDDCLNLRPRLDVGEITKVTYIIRAFLPFLYSSVLLSLEPEATVSGPEELETFYAEQGDLSQPRCILGSARFTRLSARYSSLTEGTLRESATLEVVESDIIQPLTVTLRALHPAVLQNLELDPVSELDFILHIEMQFKENFWSPWHLPSVSPELQLCREVSALIFAVGELMGDAAVAGVLYRPFQALLMAKASNGYFEYEPKALASGVLAGYCCLLTSTDSKIQRSKVKTLLTNAIFLHSRETCSLHGIRAAVMCLCCTLEPAVAAREIILPVIQSCACCADPSVRRSASSVLYSFVGYLSTRLEAFLKPSVGLFEECWLLASQLARDDYTAIGGRHELSSLHLDTDSADWACVSTSLATLHRLYVLLCQTQADPSLQIAAEPKQLISYTLQLFAKLMNTVVEETSIENSSRLFATHRQHWAVLTTALIHVNNKILPTCQEDFRDSCLLPWIYRLAEMNNMISDRDVRLRISKCLMNVFSTAAYCLDSEKELVAWILPGLDRLRLDFVEAGENACSHEIEQLSLELHQRLSRRRSDSDQTAIRVGVESKRMTFNAMKGKFNQFLENTSSSGKRKH